MVEKKAVRRGTIRDSAYKTLARSSGPMNYREIAERMRRAGYRSTRSGDAEDQLRRNVWVALTRDYTVVKVGAGVFDLASRKPPL